MNKIYNDDCFNIFETIDEDSINLVLVDLPYGQTNCKWDVKIDLFKMWDRLFRICKNNAVYVFFATTKFGNEIINSNPDMFRYDLVWEKSISVGFFNCNKMPLRSHEMIYIFYKNSCVYNPQKTKGVPYVKKNKTLQNGVYGERNKKVDTVNETGDRHPKSVLKFHQNGEKLHPTQKPLDLCEWIIKTYTNEGDLVLDFCMGSGTTIVGCINTNRNYIGVEKDEKIFLIAEGRIEIKNKLDV